MITCPTCRHGTPFDSIYCSRCATRLNDAATVLPEARPLAATPVQSSNAVTILVLGILSICVCGVMGPIAWWLGNKELERIKQGYISTDQLGMTKAGWVCGIVGTALFALTLLWCAFIFSHMWRF